MRQRVADRVPGLRRARRGEHRLGSRACRRGIGDAPPVHDRRGAARRAPFHHRDPERPRRLRGDRREHRGMRQRLGDPLALQPELAGIDAARGVDGKHQERVDRRGLGTGGAGGECGGQAEDGAPSHAEVPSRYASRHGGGQRRRKRPQGRCRAHQSRHISR
jgi:hypothetical protein